MGSNGRGEVECEVIKELRASLEIRRVLVMCWARLGSKARAWAGLSWAWAYGDAEPSPVGGLGLGWAWLGLGPGLAI